MRPRFDGSLPSVGSVPVASSAEPERIVVLGHDATLRHLLDELVEVLPDRSQVDVLTDREEPEVARVIEATSSRSRTITVSQRQRSAVSLAREGSPELCAADAVVILGEEGADDVNGDASALAMAEPAARDRDPSRSRREDRGRRAGASGVSEPVRGCRRAVPFAMMPAPGRGPGTRRTWMRREDRGDAGSRNVALDRLGLLGGGIRAVALALVLCAPIGAAPSMAAAQQSSDEQARLHFQVAASYYEQADYESALREFQSAYRLSQRAQLFFNISLCYQQLGNLDEAITYLERYLNEVTEIENRPSLEQRLGNLRSRRDQRVSTGTDPGDGATDAGTGTTGGEPGAGEIGAGETGTGATSTAPSGGGDSTNVPAIVGFSIAGVGLVAGAIFSGLTLAEDGRVSGLACAPTQSCTDADVGTLNTMALVSDISWGVSLAGAIVGVVFLFVPTGGSSSTDSASLRLSPWLGQVNGLSLTGSF